MPQGWEGNGRSGVALAMRHRLKWFIHLRAQRPRVGDEHPTYAPAGAWLPLPLHQNIEKVYSITVLGIAILFTGCFIRKMHFFLAMSLVCTTRKCHLLWFYF